MPDQHITEQAALAAWERTDRSIRVSTAHARLVALRRLSSLMRHNDRQDCARSVWREFIDGQDEREAARLTPHEVAAQAAVLAGVAWYLTERDIVAYARDAWGGRPFFAHCSADTHLAWYPEDETVIITRSTLNGTTTVIQLSPGGVSGRVL